MYIFTVYRYIQPTLLYSRFNNYYYKGRKEDKATANRGGLDWSYAGLLDKPSEVVS